MTRYFHGLLGYVSLHFSNVTIIYIIPIPPPPPPLLLKPGYFHRLLGYVSLHFTNIAIIKIKKNISVLRLFMVATKGLFPLIIVRQTVLKTSRLSISTQSAMEVENKTTECLSGSNSALLFFAQQIGALKVLRQLTLNSKYNRRAVINIGGKYNVQSRS